MSRPTKIKNSLVGIRRFVRYFSPYLKDYKLLIAGAFAGLFAQAAVRLLEPWPLKFIIDKLTYSGNSRSNWVLEFLSSLDTNTYFLLLAASLVLITALRAYLNYITIIYTAVIGNRLLTKIRGVLFGHLQNMSLSFHSKERSGDLITRVIGDIGMIKEIAITAVLPLIGNSIIFFGVVGVMLWMHWQLTLVALSTLPFLWLSTVKRSRKIQVVARKNRKRQGAMAATASESITAIKTVQALSLENSFANEFSSANTKSLKEGVQTKRLTAGLERTVDILIAISTAIVLWYGANLVVKNVLTPGDLLVFIYYLRRIFSPIRNFAKYTARLAKASAAGERVLDILEIEPEVRDLPNAKTAPVLDGDIDFQNVSFSYDEEQHAVHEVDLQIKSGEKVAFVGPSGSGKSTLAALLLRLYDPQSGQVKISGKDIKNFTLNSLRPQISIVLPETTLFVGTIGENICAGLDDFLQEEVINAAKLANIHDYIMGLPDGYDTRVGERGVTLSTGQKQRIAIARAAMRNSSILILDEPTTGLDPATEKSVSDALDILARNRTTIVITHRLDTAARCDRIIFVLQGKIAAQGSHSDLIQQNSEYAHLFALEVNEG